MEMEVARMGQTIGGNQSARMVTGTWLTPRWILDALGDFDFDPCAAPDPVVWPTARHHITLPADGLEAPWHGRVWMNPPYSREASRWIARMAEHGRGTALLFARTDTTWFSDGVLNHPAASALLFLRGRVKFHRPVTLDAPDNGGAPSVLVAYGSDDAERLRISGLRGSYVPLRTTCQCLTSQRTT
jgi:hypothetical protein